MNTKLPFFNPDMYVSSEYMKTMPLHDAIGVRNLPPSSTLHSYTTLLLDYILQQLPPTSLVCCKLSPNSIQLCPLNIHPLAA
jgi:hypothetical protein